MSKFIIKESSIKDGINQRYLSLIQEELAKYVAGVRFEIAFKQGNFAISESSDFDLNDYTIMSPERLLTYIKETLNFRYENFTITLI